MLSTTRTAHGVDYKVIDDATGDVIWTKGVRFGRGRYAGVGGRAFVDAAREQERVALAHRTEAQAMGAGILDI